MKKKKKTFDCVEMMHGGQAEVAKKLAGMSPEEQRKMLAQEDGRVAGPSAADLPAEPSRPRLNMRRTGNVLDDCVSFNYVGFRLARS